MPLNLGRLSNTDFKRRDTMQALQQMHALSNRDMRLSQLKAQIVVPHNAMHSLKRMHALRNTDMQLQPLQSQLHEL